jgi:ribosomal protein L31E
MQTGQRHTIDTRLKISAAASRRWARRRGSSAVSALRRVASRHGEHELEVIGRDPAAEAGG